MLRADTLAESARIFPSTHPFDPVITFIAIALSISGLIHWFLYARLVAAFEISSPTILWSLRAVAALLAGSYFIARSLESTSAPWHLVTATHWISCVWMGFMIEFLWMGAAGMLVKAALVISGSWARMGPVNQALLGRQMGMLAIAVATLLCGYAIWRARSPAKIVSFEVPVKQITDDLRRLKILLVSDTHAGVLINRGQLSRMVEEVNAQNADLILIPGDIIDAPAHLLEDLVPIFAKLHAPLGVFGSTGNHEYYIGRQGAIDLIREAKISLLLNERVELPNGLVIAGIEDRTARQMGLPRPDVADLVGEIARTKPTILLDHTPAKGEIDRATAAGADLVVCGHTHGGQMWPFHYLVKRAFTYFHGMYRSTTGHVITTCGIGYWGPPMRLGAPPEIVIIRLVGMDEGGENDENRGISKPEIYSQTDEG